MADTHVLPKDRLRPKHYCLSDEVAELRAEVSRLRMQVRELEEKLA